MAQRRASILDAARRCFARKGFHATTIADLCAEAGVSAGGVYTHFANKHAIVAALGSVATEGAGPPDLLAQFRQLQTEEGTASAALDLQLWAASTSDPELTEMVHTSMDAFREGLAALGHPDARVVMLEALTLGFEVQRALGRPSHPTLEAEVLRLAQRDSHD